MGRLDPPSDISERKLVTATVKAGERFGRLFRNEFPDPLGFGKNGSRFSDPRLLPDDERFGVLYLGISLKVCFVETILRDRGIGGPQLIPIDEQELADRNYTEVEVTAPLKLVDLRADGLVRMRIPSDVAGGSEHTLSRKWSLAFYRHPSQPDGIIYPSRFNEETNLAVYDRAIGKLRAKRHGPLMDETELWRIVRDFEIALG